MRTEVATPAHPLAPAAAQLAASQQIGDQAVGKSVVRECAMRYRRAALRALGLERQPSAQAAVAEHVPVGRAKAMSRERMLWRGARYARRATKHHQSRNKVGIVNAVRVASVMTRKGGLTRNLSSSAA